MEKFLLYAIKKKDTTKVLQLLRTPGYDINYVSEKKLTPLILASKLCLVPVVENLIKQGANLSQCDGKGRTALHYAACRGHSDIVKLLIQAGCDIRAVSEDGDEAIHEAVTYHSVDTVTALVEAGSDVNKSNHVTGITPLELAVMYVNPDVVGILLKNNANPHYKSREGETALHYAVQLGSQSIMEQLLQAGVNINAVNLIGETALSIAIQSQRLDTVKFLVQAGCNMYYQDYTSALCLACRQNSQKIIRYLLSEGYNVTRDTYIRRCIYLKLEESNPTLMCYVYYRCENPLTLKETCRLAVRRHLCPGVANKILQLNIPRVLKNWIAADFIY